MSKFWSGVAKFLAVLFSIGFVLTAVVSLLLVTIDRRVLSAAIYKRALQQQEVYRRLPRIIAEQLVVTMNYDPCTENPLVCEGATPEFLNCAQTTLGAERYTLLVAGKSQPTAPEMDLLQPCIQKFGINAIPGNEGGQSGGGPPSFMQNLDVTNWESIISKLVPSDVLQRMTNTLLDQIFAYLNGNQNRVVLNLVNLKERISGQIGLEAVLELIRAQPACTDQQLELMTSSLRGQQNMTVLCRPPEDLLNQMTPMIQAQLKNVALQIPDEQVILSPESGENSTASGPFGGGLTGAIRLAHFIMRLSPDIPFAFLLLTTFLAVRQAKDWLRWWGIPFFFTGLLSTLVGILASASFERIWVRILANRIPSSLSLGLITLMHDLARSIFQSVLGGILFTSIFLGLLGLGMWIGSIFIRSENRLKAPTPPSEPAA